MTSPRTLLVACALLLLATPAVASAPPQTRAHPRATTAMDAAPPQSAARSVPPSNEKKSPSQRGSADEPPAPITLGAIKVRGFPLGTAIKAHRELTPGVVSLVDGRTFFQRSVTNIAAALRYVPGVLIQSNAGGDDAIVSVRGSNLSALNYDNSGVVLFQDGLPVTTADGNNHNRFVNPLAARAIIVANGANALTYGASTLGGAIDVISRTARNSDPRQVYLYGGSYGLYGGHVSAGGVSGDFDGMLTVAGKHFDGYRQHSREHRVSVNGNAGWRVSDDLKLRLFATYINSRQQLAGSLTRAEFHHDPRQAAPAYALGDHQKNVTAGRTAVKGTWDIDAHSQLQFGVSYEVQSLYHPIVDVYDFRFDPPRKYFSLLVDTTQRTTGAMVRYHHVAGDHNVLMGVNLAHTTNQGGNYQNNEGHRGARTNIIDQRADNATLFVVDRWTFVPRWTLVYGAQGVVTSRDLRNVSLAYHSVRHQQATYASINPRVGVIYHLSPNSEAFASVSRIYAPPTNYDLDNDVRNNNSTLHAVHGVAYEIGTRGAGTMASHARTWHWSLALYYARLHDEILSVENPAQPGTMLSTNYDATTHAGVEALLGASFRLGDSAHRIEPLVSATWNAFSFDDDPVYGNNPLPYAPDYLVHGQIMYRNKSTGFYAGPTFDLAGSRYADMANTYHVNGYALLGLRVGIQRDQWQLFAEVKNLADNAHVSAVSVRTRAGADARVLNPGAPRTMFIGMQVRY